MTTIHVARPSKVHAGWQVFANYEGEDDRFTFGVKSFSTEQAAMEYAEWLAFQHEAVMA